MQWHVKDICLALQVCLTSTFCLCKCHGVQSAMKDELNYQSYIRTRYSNGISAHFFFNLNVFRSTNDRQISIQKTWVDAEHYIHYIHEGIIESFVLMLKPI